jgi:hypothetical protein|tara:strand:- start:542 stop:949 length:408 start_codon:yes stop_codon:yes gene_type:complete
MIKGYLTRLIDDGNQTLGVLTLFDGLDKIFECKTLELPWKDNKTNVSCVPKSVYKVLHRTSEKYKKHFILQDVRDRRYILIHQGNFNTDTRGCILVGSSFRQVNNDSLLDITSSKRTLSQLLEATEGEVFELTIT